eukprot:1150099-Pelagomonas_calceolata.AAC.12
MRSREWCGPARHSHSPSNAIEMDLKGPLVWHHEQQSIHILIYGLPGHRQWRPLPQVQCALRPNAVAPCSWASLDNPEHLPWCLLQGVVKQFFNEKEVTSTLVMDALYSGCKQIDEHSRMYLEVRAPSSMFLESQDTGAQRT